MSWVCDPELFEWLSTPENPPVRYLSARDLQKRRPSASQLEDLRTAALGWDPLAQILETQLDDGSFPYRQKTPTAQPTMSPLLWLVDHQRFDHKAGRAGGDQVWPYKAPSNCGCWDSVSCFHGVAGAFLAFAAVPPEQRSADVSSRLDEAIAYLLPITCIGPALESVRSCGT